MTRGRASKPLLGAGIILGFGIALFLAFALGRPSGNDARGGPARSAPTGPLRARAIRLGLRPIDLEIRGTGEVRHRDAVDLVSEVERRLVKILVREGEVVKKGQLLFLLDAADIEARIRRLEVQRDFAKRSFERLDKVVGSGAASRTEWDNARARLDELEAELGLESVNLDKTRVRAPFAGTLGLVQVSEGALVGPSQRLASLFDTSHLEIDFRVPGRFSSQLVPGLGFSAQIEGEAHARTGTVTAVEPRIDAQTQSVIARGRLEASPGLRAGSYAKVEVHLGTKPSLLVPSHAVVPGAFGRQVFRVKDGRAVATPVELGERTVTEIVIEKGLEPGDVVVVSNLLRIRDGSELEVEIDREQKAPAR